MLLVGEEEKGNCNEQGTEREVIEYQGVGPSRNIEFSIHSYLER